MQRSSLKNDVMQFIDCKHFSISKWNDDTQAQDTVTVTPPPKKHEFLRSENADLLKSATKIETKAAYPLKLREKNQVRNHWASLERFLRIIQTQEDWIWHQKWRQEY